MAKIRMTRKEKARRFNEQLGEVEHLPPISLDDFMKIIANENYRLEDMQPISATIH